MERMRQFQRKSEDELREEREREEQRQFQKYVEDKQRKEDELRKERELEFLRREREYQDQQNQEIARMRQFEMRMRQFDRPISPPIQQLLRMKQFDRPISPRILMNRMRTYQHELKQNQQKTPHQILQNEIQIIRGQSNLKIFDLISIQARNYNLQAIQECTQCGLFKLGLDFHNHFHLNQPCQDPKQCFSIKNFGQIPFWSGLFSDNQLQQQQQNDLNFWSQQQNSNTIVAMIINKMQMRQMNTKISYQKINSLIDNNQMCLDCSFCKCQGQAQLVCPNGHSLSYMSFYEELIENIQCDVCQLPATQIKVGTYRCKGCDYDMCLNCAVKQNKR